MCGARIGCIVSKNKDLMATAMKFAQARLSPPTLAQIASEAALDTPQSYFDDVIDGLGGVRVLVVRFEVPVEAVEGPVKTVEQVSETGRHLSKRASAAIWAHPTSSVVLHCPTGVLVVVGESPNPLL